MVRVGGSGRRWGNIYEKMIMYAIQSGIWALVRALSCEIYAS